MYEWETLPWGKIQKGVFKLQKRIYQASKSGNIKKVRKLQRLLLNSWSAKCLAVRRVTQENRNTLIINQAKQVLLALALEPAWEAKFEKNSHDLRPIQNCHDAIEAVQKHLKTPKYVLEAKISGCFTDINHSYLLNKLNTSPKIRKQIKACLKSGVIDSNSLDINSLFPWEHTNPQVREISPLFANLLANIALHDLDKVIKHYSKTVEFAEKYWGNKYRQISLQDRMMQMGFIKYADNLVVIHEKLEAIFEVKEIVEKWLKDIGFQLEDSKTKIVHTLNEYEGNVPGFDFLGFNFRSYRDKKSHIHKTKTLQVTPKKFVSIIKPSKESIKVHQATLSKIIRKNGKSITQEDLICKLNPVIMGFANYYHKSSCWSDQCAKLDQLIYLKLRRWALRRHPRKGGRWVKDRYWWDNRPGHKWEFKTKDGVELLKYSNYKVKKNIKTHINVNLKVYKTRYDHNACIHNNEPIHQRSRMKGNFHVRF